MNVIYLFFAARDRLSGAGSDRSTPENESSSDGASSTTSAVAVSKAAAAEKRAEVRACLVCLVCVSHGYCVTRVVVFV